MKPCIFMARPVFKKLLGSLRQHLKRLRGQGKDRWLFRASSSSGPRLALNPNTYYCE
jgi:hypothetical protein